jgi:hypothetical protein
MFQAAAAGAGGVNFHGGVHNRRASEEKSPYTDCAQRRPLLNYREAASFNPKRVRFPEDW